MRSHAAGVGSPLEDSTVRLILVLKAASLARGFSGVRPVVIERLLQLVKAGIHPVVPSQGSVGASGDLAPLAHLSLALIGEGRVRVAGKEQDCGAALKAAGIEPLVLGPKEGLALLNGTQVSTALALEALFAAEDLLAGSILSGAMSVDAALGSRVPFDARIHNARGQPAQIAVAAAFREVLGESDIGRSHENCDRVQDPYSLRCQPQVAGACLQQIQDVARTLMLEANGVSDNPLVFGKEGEVLSGGNFHAEPVAFAADNLALAIAEIGALAERRIAMLIDDSLSQLPAFLVRQGGLNSGFMIAQVTAAALASENKSLAHPASVDSLPTSANQEDHVSMATFAARRLGPMAENTRGVIAIELLAAAQGIDFRRPLGSSPALEKAHALLARRKSPSTTTTASSRRTLQPRNRLSHPTNSSRSFQRPDAKSLAFARRAGSGGVLAREPAGTLRLRSRTPGHLARRVLRRDSRHQDAALIRRRMIREPSHGPLDARAAGGWS